MKQITTIALMLSLGVAAVYAQQDVNMTYSGTAAAGAVNLQYPGTTTVEENFAGNGALGPFTFRNLSAETASPQPSSSCSGPTKLYFLRVAGGGVFRFQDGSLMYVTLTQGDDCIDLAAQSAHCTMSFQINGGTGRFNNASGIFRLSETTVPVVGDFFHNPVFFAAAGGFTGTVSRVAPAQEGSQQ